MVRIRFAALMGRLSQSRASIFEVAVVVIFAVASVSPWVYLARSGFSKFQINSISVFDSDESKYAALRHGAAQCIQFINNFLPEDAKLLVFRQADFAYYGKRPFISFEDPKLLPLYEQATAESASQFLQGLGVTHLLVPDYAVPPLYNSSVAELLSDPKLASLVFEAQGYKVFSLGNISRARVSGLALSGEWFTSSLVRHLNPAWQVQNGDGTYMFANEGHPLSDNISLERLYAVYGMAPLDIAPSKAKSDSVLIVDTESSYFTVSGSLRLSGSASLYLALYDGAGRYLGLRHMWSGLAKNRRVTVSGASIAGAPVHSVRPVIALDGTASAEAPKIELIKWEGEGVKESDGYDPITAIAAGWDFPRADVNPVFWGRRLVGTKETVGFKQLSSHQYWMKSPVQQHSDMPNSIKFRASGRGLFTVNILFACMSVDCYGSYAAGEFFLSGGEQSVEISNIEIERLKMIETGIVDDVRGKRRVTLPEEDKSMLPNRFSGKLNVRLEFIAPVSKAFKRTKYQFVELNVSDIVIE